MILSYLHNFIFIKTRKTAGTAVEATLAPICGPADVITPIGEMFRGEAPPLCRNFSSNPDLEHDLRRAMLRGKSEKAYGIFSLLQPITFTKHIDAAKIKTQVAPEFWARAWKFTVERHPYEKAVSQAYFRHAAHGNDRPFSEFLEDTVQKGAYASWDFYTIGEEVVVNEFLRQETLHRDLRRLGARLGIPIPDELPHTKTQFRTDRRPAREILSDAQKEIIYRTCKREFDFHGFET